MSQGLGDHPGSARDANLDDRWRQAVILNLKRDSSEEWNRDSTWSQTSEERRCGRTSNNGLAEHVRDVLRSFGSPGITSRRRTEFERQQIRLLTIDPKGGKLSLGMLAHRMLVAEKRRSPIEENPLLNRSHHHSRSYNSLRQGYKCNTMILDFGGSTEKQCIVSTVIPISPPYRSLIVQAARLQMTL